jgi:GNAT superfamily N-acetyltransferase
MTRSAIPAASVECAPIRRARIEDAAEIARLSGELGYPLSSADVALRLDELSRSERHDVLVAADGERLLGWLQVEHRLSLEGGERAELVAMVVDATVRRRGIGRALVGAAESWGRARGLPSLIVRSNVARERAHPFYESLGYSRSKTQHVYTKKL